MSAPKTCPTCGAVEGFCKPDPFHDLLKKHRVRCAYWSGVGPGWFPLLEDAFRRMRALGWPGAGGQIKEKFGTLRFSADHTQYHKLRLKKPNQHGHDWVWRRGRTTPEAHQGVVSAIADEAERRSASVCDSCGQPGRLYGTTPSGGWYSTRCVTCAVDRDGRALYPLGDDE